MCSAIVYPVVHTSFVYIMFCSVDFPSHQLMIMVIVTH